MKISTFKGEFLESHIGNGLRIENPNNREEWIKSDNFHMNVEDMA